MCKLCWENRFATPEVAIHRENVLIPALGVGIWFTGERLEYPLEYFVQHLSIHLLLFIQLLLRNIADLDPNQQESDHYDTVC
jgi:hypothetical protein